MILREFPGGHLQECHQIYLPFPLGPMRNSPWTFLTEGQVHSLERLGPIDVGARRRLGGPYLRELQESTRTCRRSHVRDGILLFRVRFLLPVANAESLKAQREVFLKAYPGRRLPDLTHLFARTSRFRGKLSIAAKRVVRDRDEKVADVLIGANLGVPRSKRGKSKK